MEASVKTVSWPGRFVADLYLHQTHFSRGPQLSVANNIWWKFELLLCLNSLKLSSMVKGVCTIFNENSKWHNTSTLGGFWRVRFLWELLPRMIQRSELFWVDMNQRTHQHKKGWNLICSLINDKNLMAWCKWPWNQNKKDAVDANSCWRNFSDKFALWQLQIQKSDM